LQNRSAIDEPVVSQCIAGISNLKFGLVGKNAKFVAAGDVVLITGNLLVSG
jgi:hypothetical protein